MSNYDAEMGSAEQVNMRPRRWSREMLAWWTGAILFGLVVNLAILRGCGAI